jgi:hypothetical protein
MKQDVEQYVKGCAVCQANKVNTRLLKPSLIPITPEHTLPFQTIAMDFITKLPVSEGYNTILTITDHDCSKAAIFIPCKETITAEGVADLYLKYIYLQIWNPQESNLRQRHKVHIEIRKRTMSSIGDIPEHLYCLSTPMDSLKEQTNGSKDTSRCYCKEHQKGLTQVVANSRSRA